MPNSIIAGTGSYLPERIVTNLELSKMFSTSDEWIREKIGIKERRFAQKGEGPSHLAARATQKALKAANLQAKDIDAIVFATNTPEHQAPGSGALLQDQLGFRNIPAFDIRNTSPGFLYALDLADGLIKSERYKNVLVVGSEVHSTSLDFSDAGRLMSVIFGDGAGCVILSASDQDKGLRDFKLYSEGKYYNQLWCDCPSSLEEKKTQLETTETGKFYPQMDGRVVFKNAVNNMTEAVKNLLISNAINVADIDFFLSHQANIRIIEKIGENLNLESAQVPTHIDRYGNTSSASIPILLDESVRNKQITSGSKLVAMSFGAGFCWGACLIDL